MFYILLLIGVAVIGYQIRKCYKGDKKMNKFDKNSLMQIIAKALNEADIPSNTPAFPYYSFTVLMVAKGRWDPFEPEFFEIIANYFQTSLHKVSSLMHGACPPNTEPRTFIDKIAETIKLLIKREDEHNE